VFTPAAVAGSLVTRTTFIVVAQGAGGTTGDGNASALAVEPVLGLGSVPASSIVISVSSDGTTFAPPSGGKTNIATLTVPTTGGVYSLPGGYQAEYLGGNADVHLRDRSVGNALLVANQGNDLLTATADKDTIQAGSGSDTVTVVAANATVLAGTGNSLMVAENGTSDVFVGGIGNDTLFSSGSGTLSGGSGASVIALYGSASASNTIILSGTGDTVAGDAGSDAISISGAASSALVFGSGTTTRVQDNGSHDTIVAGSGATTVAGNGDALVFGGAAGLLFTGGSGTATIVGGPGNSTIDAGSGGVVFSAGSGGATVNGLATLFGAPGADLDYVGSVGGALAVFGNGAETIDASASSTSNTLWGGIDATGGDLMVGGSGTDTLIAGTAADTMSGGSGSNMFLFIQGQAGGADVVTDFTAADTVFLMNYGIAEAGIALAGAVSGGGNTTLALSDSTTITFLGVPSAAALAGHVFSS
jgi:Ca2+-binding RTX toxin-like protein